MCLFETGDLLYLGFFFLVINFSNNYIIFEIESNLKVLPLTLWTAFAIYIPLGFINVGSSVQEKQ